jgi:hypothetical protein
MAELDKIPQKQNVEIAIVKLDEDVLSEITELNRQSSLLLTDFGTIYIRKKELAEEIIRLDEILVKAEEDFKNTNTKLSEVFNALDEQYPQGRVNLQDGTIQYQPGAPTRKQQAEQQAQQASTSQMKVVKE